MEVLFVLSVFGFLNNSKILGLVFIVMGVLHITAAIANWTRMFKKEYGSYNHFLAVTAAMIIFGLYGLLGVLYGVYML